VEDSIPKESVCSLQYVLMVESAKEWTLCGINGRLVSPPRPMAYRLCNWWEWGRQGGEDSFLADRLEEFVFILSLTRLQFPAHSLEYETPIAPFVYVSQEIFQHYFQVQCKKCGRSVHKAWFYRLIIRWLETHYGKSRHTFKTNEKECCDISRYTFRLIMNKFFVGNKRERLYTVISAVMYLTGRLYMYISQ
jgi:hypothetical protein